MLIKTVDDKQLINVLTLIRTIRPDCIETIGPKIDKFYCKHVKEDLSDYDFTEYLDYIEKRLVYEPGIINIGVVMNWGQEFKQHRNRTWTIKDKENRENFYTTRT